MRGLPLQAGGRAREQAMMELLRHDQTQRQLAFEQDTHTCEVCYDDKAGSEFARLRCGHDFCKECCTALASVSLHAAPSGLTHSASHRASSACLVAVMPLAAVAWVASRRLVTTSLRRSGCA